MAKQRGITRFEGSIGDLSFYNDKRCGDIVRRKGGPSRRQIRTMKSCKAVRQNNTEFGRASRAGKLLRNSFYPLITLCGDNRLSGRVQKKLMEVLKKDTRHKPGARMLLQENFAGLGCLALTEAYGPDRYFELPVKRVLKKDALAVRLRVATATAENGATHFAVVSVAAIIDFKAGTEVHEVKKSGMEMTGPKPVAMEFTHTLKGKGILFHGLSIVFYQWVNGAYCLLHHESLKTGAVEWVAPASKAV